MNSTEYWTSAVRVAWSALLVVSAVLLTACGGGMAADFQPDQSRTAASADCDSVTGHGEACQAASRKTLLAASTSSLLAANELTEEQVLAYIASYPDLVAAFGTNTSAARAHYEAGGKNEGRTITFSALNYIASYEDLISVFGIDTETATRQYIRSGISQGRRVTFDGLKYIASNPDLRATLGNDAEAGARHYILAGRAEGRSSSFDALRYIASYGDLILAFGRDVLAATMHYISAGFTEGRRASFNVEQYLANYADLRQVFGDDHSAATQHYIVNGWHEGRSDQIPNASPIARIATEGGLRIQLGGTLSLDGSSSSDPEGGPITYAWSVRTKPQGSTAQLGSPNSPVAAISPDVAGDYTIDLVVSDGRSQSARASVVVVANFLPVASAEAPRTLIAGGLVALNSGNSRGVTGGPLAFSWIIVSKPQGSSATLTNAQSPTPSFTADVPGIYSVSLVVYDAGFESLPSTVAVTAKAVPFGSLTGSWDAIANGTSSSTDGTDLSVSLNGSTLSIRAEQFFDGTCIYTAILNAARDGIAPGQYQCSDFTTGSWQLLEMKRVDNADIYIEILKDGARLKRIYGMKPNGSTGATASPALIASLVGEFEGIATGGPFGTDRLMSLTLSVNGDTLTIVANRFFSGTCRYTAVIGLGGRTITDATFQCSDFTTGTWSLLDIQEVANDAIHLSILVDGVPRRAFGLRQ